MNIDDMILISVDDHLNEPPDMFDEHLPKKYRDRAPRIVHQEDGSDYWIFDGQELRQAAIFAVAGKPKEDWGIEPIGFADIRKGCWDIHSRIQDMNAGGVLASLTFPSFPGFAGRVFAAAKDRDLALALVRAYNDWHIDEWAKAYPGRMIPCAIPVLWDAELAAEEVRRVAKKGCRAITFSEAPDALGYPSYHSHDWDPLWRAVCDEDVIVCVHLGSSGKSVEIPPEAPLMVLSQLQPLFLSNFAANLLWSHVLRDFPTIKFALSEGGIGWIPYFLDRADYSLEQQGKWTGFDFGGDLPSEIFRQHVVTCFIDDPTGIRMRDIIGLDMITWENDYPHSDSSWPVGPESLAKQLEGLSDKEVNMISHENAMRHFHFDPFVHRSKIDSTVGALRLEAAGVDVTTPSSRKSARPTRPVTGIDAAIASGIHDT